jgi:hypothetical protein
MNGQLMLWKVFRELPLWLALAFCLGLRVAFHFLYGLTYDLNVTWWQMLDPELLRTAPWQSIYLMHMQPPLLNLLYAAVLALPDVARPVLMQALFGTASLIMVVILYASIRRFGAGPYAAGLGAALFGALPQVILYENLFFYSHLEAVLVLVATACASAYFEHRRLHAFIGLAVCLVTLGLLRSLFHLGWIAVVLSAVCLLSRRQHGWDLRAVFVACVSILLVGSVYLKNFCEFDVFKASSWDGVSLMNMMLPTRAGDDAKFPSAVEDIRERSLRGDFSPATDAALKSSDIFSAWVEFAKGCDRSSEQRPVLCAVRRSDSRLNYNHLAMIDYSKAVGRDAWSLLWLHPRVYLDHVGSSVFSFLGTPAWNYQTLPARLEAYTSIWNKLLLYDPGYTLKGSGRTTKSWWASVMNRLAASSLPLLALIVIGSTFIVIAGIRDVIGYWRRTQKVADWIFPALVLGLFALVPNLINGVEAQRIRYSIEPVIYLALFAAALRLLGRSRTPE